VKIFAFQEQLLGKKVYRDRNLKKLEEKFKPKKVTYFSGEFISTKENCDVILLDENSLLDFIVEDIEKLERLLGKEEKELVKKALEILDKGKPLFTELAEEERVELKDYNLITLKPVVFLEGDQDLDTLWEKIFKTAGIIFFYTVNKNEARSYPTREGTSIVFCAGKIHSDLARGFIRAEVFNIKDIDNFHNLEEARQKGFLKVVGKDYTVVHGDVVNVKFSA